jgi:hypothetical protein
MQPPWIIQVAMKIQSTLNIQVSGEPAPVAMFPKASSTTAGLFKDLQRTVAVQWHDSCRLCS